MSHRIGVCSSCDAKYKVPADFASDKAKCKECGDIVEIGAVVDDPPPPPVPAKPVRKAAPKMEEHVPSGKKSGEPTMMERLKAERRAKSAKLTAPAPTAKPAAAKKTAPKAAAPKARAAAASTGDSEEKKPKARASSRRGAGASSRRSAPKGSSRRRGEEADEEEGEEKAGRRGRAKKKSPMPLIATLGLLLVAGAAGAYFMFSGGEEEGESTEIAKIEPTAEQTPEETTEEPAQVKEEAAVEEAAVEEVAEAPKEEKPKPVAQRKEKDPMEIDLAALADFPAPSGCSADEWGSLQEDAALMVDPLAGAAGGRAGKRLHAAGRLAIPALINVFKTRDLGSDDGFRDGDLLQRTLEKIYNGKNFGWKYTTEPNDHWYNRRVVELWWKNWDKFQGDEAGWLKFTGLDKEGQTPSDGSGDDLSTDELDALDDI